MLVRSAGRRQRHHQTTQILAAASFARLHLPWLAPAQLRWSATHPSPAVRPRRRESLRHQQEHLGSRRQLATAADQYTPQDTANQNPPPYVGGSSYRNFHDPQQSPWHAGSSLRPGLSNLRPYDDPIIINTSTQTPGPTIRVSHGLYGTAIELLQHLRTSLQIGRLDRAEAIIHRLGDKCAANAPELVHAHTAYLEEYLRTIALLGRGARARTALAKMQKWFEVEIKGKGVRIDAKMLVVMIRASIRALEDVRRDRTIRRYVDMARALGDEYYEVLESEEYDDNEFTILGRVSSEYYVDPGPEEAAMEGGEQSEAVVEASNDDRETAIEELKEVHATEQKGGGLARIKRSLQPLNDLSALSPDATLEERREHARARQKILERTSVDVALDRWRKADDELRRIGIHTAMQSKPVGALMWQWHQALLPALEAELAECRKQVDNRGKDQDREHYGPYLEMLSLDWIATNTILTIMNRVGQGSPSSPAHGEPKYSTEFKLSTFIVSLASVIENECIAIASQRAASGNKGSGNATQRIKQSQNRRVKGSKWWRRRMQALQAPEQMRWPLDTKVKLGAMLFSKFMETAQLPVTKPHPRTQEKVTQMQPAFLHRSKYRQGKRIGFICPNPALVEKLQSEPVGSVLAKRMPMIVEPKPWSGWNSGGYLHYVNDIVRLPKGECNNKDYYMAAHEKGDLDQIYAGLSVLGKVAWKIHPGVLKVQIDAWNSGEAIANFAPLHPVLDTPPEPEQSSDPNTRRRWLTEMREIENTRAGLHAQRCFQNFQLEVARTMAKDVMYFPHNMDFRGRAYPIPPYLNHMGADNVRGLLVFAEGKELGEKGLRWLKVHLATVAGYDKASLEERVDFTMKHLDDIYDSARNPLEGRKWWLQAEDSWQTLAACFELAAALDSPDPTKFVSHIPVQQDGTCNGLQHYAALGGDKIGAQQVNLEPGDRPADVYTAVAEAVKAEIRADAQQGNPIALKLDGRLTRKCVKQPVMTNVYGVTWYGAKEQVKRQLADLFPEVHMFDEVNHSRMAQYVATKIFTSLGTMFGGAQSIQTWLGQCADRILTSLTPEQIAELTDPTRNTKAAGGKRKNKVVAPTEELPVPPGSAQADRKQQSKAKPLFKTTVVWTTPLRLPVVQPYRNSDKRQVRTSLQAVQLSDPQVWHPVSRRKQLQAFPPNFIHSLDATHMFLSALRCNELGLTFASIHDSFWTHACDVDSMSRVLRDAFIAMHKDDIVGRLREEFTTRYNGNLYLQSVHATSTVGLKIAALRKASKQNDVQELAQEAERVRLLRSEDAEERAKGEAMVTPASIVANEADASTFVTAYEIEDQTLGTILEDGEAASAPTAAAIAEATATAAAAPSPSSPVDDVARGAEDGAQEHEDTVEATPIHEGEAPTPLPATRKTKRVYSRKMFVWMPLTFPDVPPKGEFNVEKLKDSTYFFH